MSATTYIILANIAVWGGLAAYGIFLAARAARLARRARQLELLSHE
ncbi:CcmD family protein [Paucidesulfovibrio longus]|jgi:CcmD family protein|nr:CcmD family protein [Paucidesulfovibrio longus]